MGGTVALVYVHGDYVRPAFMRSVIEHAVPSEHVEAIQGFGSAVLIANARNKACGWFLAHPGPEWLWFLDADIEIAADTLPTLLDAAEALHARVLTGHYWGLAGDELLSVWAIPDEDGVRQRLRAIPTQPTKLGGTGAGCLLIHRSVLEVVGTEHRDDPWRWFGHDITADVRLGEDFTFCQRAIDAGFPIWGIPVAVKHHKLQAI